MRRIPRLVRVLVATGVALAGVGLGLTSDTAQADDPEVCGYVRYSTNDTDPTSTVPPISPCEDFPCDGVGPYVPPNEVNDVHYEALVCVRGL